MMPDFLFYALLAGLGVALISGPLGAFVVWRRMAYLGDTLAHSALLGVALGWLLSLDFNFAVAFVCVAIALLFVFLQHSTLFATDTLLGIMAHTSLALGLVIVALASDGRLNINGYLFGDLLAVGISDIALIYAVSITVIILLCWRWRPLLAITINEDLAKVDGIPVQSIKTLLMLCLALVIAVAMKVVGVLLITALLIIPAAAARPLSNTPEKMAIIAAFIGCVSVVGGLLLSFYWDTPVGPSVVLVAFFIFLLTAIKKARQ